MIINSQNIEFGYELISVLPYAYYLYTKGKLKGTVSGNDTESLYYFSPEHKINPEQRDYHNIAKVKYPNAWIHKPYLELEKFKIPPYKEIFKNNEFKFEKETIVICNRHNKEWSYKPINYFNLDVLKEIFELLQDKYQIVYINVDGRKELYDNAPPEPLGDWDLLKKYPKVINFHDLCEGKSWNETQLKVFANCEKYITMNGGHAILAAYFPGENIIMSKYDKIDAKELRPGVNSFYTFYHQFNKQRVVSVHDEDNLIKRIKTQWIEDNPVVNILVRTSKRPRFFENCIDSINKQTYKNINIFVSKDNPNDKYTIKHKVYPIQVQKEEVPPIRKENYGHIFPSNLYYNELHKWVKEGLIIYLDDDDQFCKENAIEEIVNEYKKGNDLIFWNVKIGLRTVPNVKNFGKIVCRDISGIGVAFDNKLKTDWEGYKLGDYRVIKAMSNKANSMKWISKIYTKTQERQAGWGLQIDKQDKNNKIMKTLKIKFTKPKKGSKYKSGEIKELPQHVAKQYIITGQAVFYDENLIKKVKPKEEPKKEVKKEEPKKEIKKPKPKKRKYTKKKKVSTKEEKGTLKL